MPYNPIRYAMKNFLSIFLMWAVKGWPRMASSNSMGWPLLRMTYTFHSPESIFRERPRLADYSPTCQNPLAWHIAILRKKLRTYS
jgi:hypothetical protein